MKCLRFDLRRDFSLYLNGELNAEAVKRVEDHLIDCGSCRVRLAQLRNGHRLAQEMPRFAPSRDSWSAIEAAIRDEQQIAARGIRAPKEWRKLALKPGFAFAVIGIAALILSLVVASGRRATGEEPAGHLIADALDLDEFQTVNIANIHENHKPHVMAEGFVSEVGVNDEDGDMRFKLVDELGRPGPFIVCEIIDPFKLKTPPVGSRVRVYGVSRYDGQANHNWYEVHPVLNIEVVHR